MQKSREEKKDAKREGTQALAQAGISCSTMLATKKVGGMAVGRKTWRKRVMSWISPEKRARRAYAPGASEKQESVAGGASPKEKESGNHTGVRWGDEAIFVRKVWEGGRITCCRDERHVVYRGKKRKKL